MLARDVHDPGIGFVTITRVAVSPDLQHARIAYTALGDEQQRRTTSRALDRAAPFLRRQLGSRLRLRRTPELRFIYDEAVAGHDRIEQILNELRPQQPASDETPGPAGADAPASAGETPRGSDDAANKNAS